MANQAELGMNRTGIATSPELTEQMLAGNSEFVPLPDGGDRSIALVRGDYAKKSEGLGSVPPPMNLKGAATTAVRGLKGLRPTQFIDKLGERLAFERTGVRLYEALISKLDALGSYEGGPSRAELTEIMMEEYDHFALLTEAVAKLGGDPTVVTPSADLHATMTKGVMEVMVDARTSLPQCLEAALLAELADGDAWEALIELAGQNDDAALVEAFERALADEAKHLASVRNWIAAAQNRDAAR
jgi:bacterioferritin (cytochrome b1)